MPKYTFILLLLLAFLTNCKTNKKELPDKSIAQMPSINILLTDSSKTINLHNIKSGKPTALLYFRPDCTYSQKQIKTLINNMNTLEDVQFYFFSKYSIKKLREFSRQYQLDKFKNITIGQDFEGEFSKLFDATSFPWLVIYDRNNNLKKIIVGNSDAVFINKILRG